MNAGELRHRITFAKPTIARNTAGEKVTTWSSDGWAWAAIRPQSQREIMLSGTATATTPQTITIRYRDGLTTAHRVEFGDRVFDIAGIVNVDERNVELRLLCHETGGA